MIDPNQQERYFYKMGAGMSTCIIQIIYLAPLGNLVPNCNCEQAHSNPGAGRIETPLWDEGLGSTSRKATNICQSKG